MRAINFKKQPLDYTNTISYKTLKKPCALVGLLTRTELHGLMHNLIGAEASLEGELYFATPSTELR